jgi:GxxExxY protein
MPLIHEELTGSIIAAFYDVYNKLGFGFVEHLYGAAMERELRKRGHSVGREVVVRVYYEGEEIGLQRLDMIVDEVVVVELKSSAQLPKITPRQLLSYLHATNLEVGLLLHFGQSPAVVRLVASNAHKQFHPRAQKTQ